MLDEQEGQELELLRSWRVAADYHEDEVMMEQAREALKVAEALVHRLLGERPEW
ncbi:hypothetical protein [Myxococcus sp. RHSTA-1-4]|uniref:hypothetical protein n=1 Tax=Myxococcus sp. RHSTA-1-4 TaxID=2874601 RepID=UPI001CBFCFC7|nr:hypothetical protein [Myxococcus sp. RHSTA-1-4]MBZ4416095.1 hypothetical protein [Myxococcus sp. RHSTA-1-4]